MRTRRPALTAIGAAATLLLGAAGAHAAVTAANGSGTPVATVVYNLPDDASTDPTACPDLTFIGGERHVTATLSVSQSGVYRFRDPDMDGQTGSAAAGIVVPASADQEESCLDTFDSNGRVELEAGVQYTLLLSGERSEDSPGTDFGYVVVAAAPTTGVATINGQTGTRTQIGNDQKVTGNGTELAVIDYTLDAQSPTSTSFPDEDDTLCDGIRRPEAVAYETATLTVSATGRFQLRSSYPSDDTDVWGYAAIFAGSPTGPEAPVCVKSSDEDEEVDLEAGVVYTLFLSSFDQDLDRAGVLGRHVFSVTADDPADLEATVTFGSAVDEAVVCAPGGAVPAGYGPAIQGTPRNDTLVGTPGRDVIRGLGGNDTIRGLGGNDILCGNDGQDTIDSGEGADFVFGGAGQDVLSGGAGADQLTGGEGQDQLNGGAGDDRLAGGAGNDVLDGGAGFDTGIDTEGRNVFRNIESRGEPTQGPTPTATAR